MRAVRWFARKRLVQALVAGVGAASSLPFDTRAAELGLGLGYVGEYSDNVARTPTNEQAEWTQSALAGFAYVEATPEVGARVRAIGEYRHYTRNTFEDEVVGTADGLILWSVLPRRFNWTVEGAMRQVVVDPTQPNTPANRSQSYVVSTGPDVFLRMTSLDTLQLGGRYGSVTVQDSNVDSTAVLGYASWLHEWSPITTVSLNYQQTRVDNVDDTAFPDYTRYDGFVGIIRRQATSELIFNAGVTRIEQEGQPEKDGDFLHLSWLARLTSSSTFGITVHDGYSDTATGLLNASREFTEPSDIATAPSALNIVVSADLFFERSVVAFCDYTGARFGWNALGFWRELDFETTTDDRKESGGRLTLRHATTPNLDSSIFAGVERTTFIDTGREDEDLGYGLSFTYRAGPNVVLRFEVGHVSHDSNDPAFRYDENRALLSVFYNTNPRLPVFANL